MLKAVLMVTACAAISLLVGCVDAKKSYDDFASRVVDANTSMPDHAFFTSIPDVTGHFLLAAKPKGINADILFVADYTLLANEDGTAKLTYAASALTATDHTISAGPPAAPQFSATDMHVSIDGTFNAPLSGTLPGDANPVIANNSIVVDGVKHGQIMTTDLICGTLTGTAGPLSLDGSTFAAIRIAPGTVGTELPTPVDACP